MNSKNYGARFVSNSNSSSNSRGQFFSPDMIIAIFIFVVAISFFLISTENTNQQIGLFEERKKIDEVAHSTMNFLVYSPGIPSNWEYQNLSDINFFALVDKRNVLSEKKIEKFIEYLDQNYELVKLKTGLREFDFKFSVIDSQNNVLFSAGKESTIMKKSMQYERIASYLGQQVLIRGVFSYEK